METEEQKFTITEIYNYLKLYTDIYTAAYNLSESNIKKANKTMSFTFQEIIDSGNWDSFCDKYGVNEWCISEGANISTEKDILLLDAKEWNLI